ncbi:MAG TPA: ComEC/Rec2 family competence protein [Sphaerochaeta sp.]|nr:ComEC/Rec2 family competence protein [Sphaerochaeta sp.]
MCALLPLSVLYLYHFVPSLYAYPGLAAVVALVSIALMFMVAKRRRTRCICRTLLLFALYLLLASAGGSIEPAWAFEEDRIVALDGVLMEDSTLSRSENQVIRLRVTSCYTRDGDEGEARGIASALIKIPEPLYASTPVHLEGSFSSSSTLFIAEDTTLLEMKRFALLRRRLIAALDERLLSLLGEGTTHSLAKMLLLGQSDSEGFLLKDLAILSGCAHTLALSGMHLSFFLSISTLLLSLLVGRRWGKRVALVPPTLFVLLAGPKPSLVRALLFRFAILLPIGSTAASNGAFALQLLLFPEVLSSLSALYSWAAFSALLFSSKLPRFPLRTTALAIAATAPASLAYSGSWNAIGLLLSTPVTLLIALAMALSLVVVAGGSLCVPLLVWTTEALLSLLGWGASHTLEFGLVGYLCYLLILLTVVVSIGYAESIGKRRRRHSYEMGVRIRLSEGDQHPLGGARLCDDEEVWTELSALNPHEGEDRLPALAGSGAAGP